MPQIMYIVVSREVGATEALKSLSQRRGSLLVHVDCAYTSQMDSRYGVLLGRRSGEKFYCFDGAVLDADMNAARNVLARLDEPEIGRWTDYRLHALSC